MVSVSTWMIKLHLKHVSSCFLCCSDPNSWYHSKLHCSLTLTSWHPIMSYLFWRHKICGLIKQHCLFSFFEHEFTLTGWNLSQHFCLKVLSLSLAFNSSRSSNVQNQERSRLCALSAVMKTSTSVSLAPFWRSPKLPGSFSLPPLEGERSRNLAWS